MSTELTASTTFKFWREAGAAAAASSGKNRIQKQTEFKTGVILFIWGEQTFESLPCKMEVACLIADHSFARLQFA